MENLPHNEESERVVLASILQTSDPAIVTELADQLTEEDFFNPDSVNKRKPEPSRNALILRAIKNIRKNGVPLDLASLTNELDVNMKALTSIGGLEYLKEIIENYLGDRNALYHRNTLQDLTLARRLILQMEDCVKGFENKTFSDVGQYVATCEKQILNITQSRRVSEFVSTGDIAQKIVSEITIGEKEKKNDRINSGYSLLDSYTQGWLPGEFNILAARPSVGKTAFALNLAYRAADSSNRTVAFFSLEMEAKAIVKRMLSFTSQVNSGKFSDTKKLTPDDLLAIERAVDAIKNNKLLIDDTPAAKISDIKTKIQRLKAAHPDLGAIFIDYLGLITTNERYDSRQNEVADISRQLKAIAREVEVPIICLSQLSRNNEQRTASDRMPKLSDLRDSGSIEQDADKVMFIYRENYQNAEEMKKTENEAIDYNRSPFENAVPTKINIAKNRNGRVGIISFSFLMDIGLFVENVAENKSSGE